MATPINTGMPKAAMKKTLQLAKTQPVGCAVGLGEDNTVGLLMMHRSRNGKQCEKMLKEAFPDSKKLPPSLRWGTAFIDVAANAKLVRLTLNKPAAGMAKRLIKTLKGTGFNKVVICMDDGTEVEAHEEADPEGDAQAALDAASGVLDDADQAEDAADFAPPPPPPTEPTQADKDALKVRLTARLASLAGKVVAAAGPDADRRAVMAKVATEAKVNIVTGNLNTATELLDRLEALVAVAPAAAADPAQGGAAGSVFAAARISWNGTRQQVQADMDKLAAELSRTYAGEAYAAEIEAKFRSRVAPVLAAFDDRLVRVLDGIEAVAPEERSAKISEARSILKSYLTFTMSEPLIADLDSNPFVPLTIRSTVTSTLKVLGQSLH